MRVFFSLLFTCYLCVVQGMLVQAETLRSVKPHWLSVYTEHSSTGSTLLAAATTPQPPPPQTPPQKTTNPAPQTSESTAPAQAADTTGPLSLIPANTMGFLSIPNLQQLDTRFQAILEALDLSQILPIPSLLTALQAYGIVQEGVDAPMALSLVTLQAESPEQWMEKSGLIISTKNPQALLQSLQPKAPVQGVSPITLGDGSQGFAIATQHALILALTPEAATALAQKGSGIDTKLQPQESHLFADLDLIVWVNTAQVFTTLQALIEAFTVGLKQEAASGEKGSLAIIQSDYSTEYIDILREGMKTIAGGITLGQEGVGVRFAMGVQPESRLAKLTSGQTVASDSLLIGLPAENYILVTGQNITAEQINEGLRQLSRFWEIKELQEALGPENTKKLQMQFEEWYQMLRGGAFSFSALPAESNGLFGISAVFTVTDSKQWMSRLHDMVTHIKTLQATHAETKDLVEALSYKTDAATIAGVSIAELRVDFKLFAAQSPQDIEQAKKIIGAEGVVIRIAAVDDTRVALSFGGGESRLAQIITHIREGKAPLSDDPGVKRVAQYLPHTRFSEGYFAIDRLAALILNIAKVVGKESDVPFSVSPMNTPLAFITSGEQSFVRFDLYLPMELLLAVKNSGLGLVPQPE